LTKHHTEVKDKQAANKRAADGEEIHYRHVAKRGGGEKEKKQNEVRIEHRSPAS
jgi:hypothetical protein